MTASLPEHTVDIWVASSITARFPTAATWAPSPRQKGIWDLGFKRWPTDGKVVIFENKATRPLLGPAPNGLPDHSIRIDRSQLSGYLANPTVHARIYYVLPWPPWAGVPAGPPNPLLPVEAAHAPGASKWLWVVKGATLDTHLGPNRSSLRSSEVTDPALAARPLRDFLDDVADCDGLDGLPVWEGEPVGDTTLDNDVSPRPPTPVTAFIPIDDLNPKAQDRLLKARP